MRRTKVVALFAKREKLQAEIDQIDAEIGGMTGQGGRLGRRRGKTRLKNKKPLRPVVLEVLGKNKKGLSLNDLVEKILETGYRSNSVNFKTVVYQCL